MTKYLFTLPALAVLAACGPSPVGSWEGVVEFTTTEGGSYYNQMEVHDSGSVDITLYVLLPDPYNAGQYLLGVSDFEGDWEKGDDVWFDLNCDWSGCDYNPSMECIFEDPGMVCDMMPDYYTDDEEVLQWIQVD